MSAVSGPKPKQFRTPVILQFILSPSPLASVSQNHNPILRFAILKVRKHRVVPVWYSSCAEMLWMALHPDFLGRACGEYSADHGRPQEGPLLPCWLCPCVHVRHFCSFPDRGGSEIMEASYNSTLDFKQQSFNCLGDLWDFIHKCVFFLSRTFENVIYCHKMEIECKSFIIHM